MNAAAAMAIVWNKPLEVAERAGDETLEEAVDIAARSVERGETPLRDALTIAFAAGHLRRRANLHPAAHPPADDGAAGS